MTRATRLSMFAALVGAMAPARANPIVGASWTSPAVIVAEDVRITVGAGMSLVEGSYDFMFVRDYDDVSFRDSIIVRFPVFVPANTTAGPDAIDMTAPILRLGKLEHHAEDAELLTPAAFGPGLDVPSGCAIAVLNFRLPRSRLANRFRVQIQHRQPHLTEQNREVVAYLPLLPEFAHLKDELRLAGRNFAVTFSALDSVSLRRVSLNHQVRTETSREIVVEARHEETIVVAVSPNPSAP